MVSLALLGQFRSQWLDGPTPMVVEHTDGQAEHICAAPSLWMGGKQVAEGLRAAGMGPGHRVVFAGDTARGWVQTLVGCLREGVCFDARNGADSAGALAPCTVDDSLTVHASPSPKDLAQGDTARVLFDDGVTLGEPDLDLLAEDARAPLSGPHTRLLTRGLWRDVRAFALELLGPLAARMEIHVVRDVSAATLAALTATDSLPHVMTTGLPSSLSRGRELTRALGLRVAFDLHGPGEPSGADAPTTTRLARTSPDRKRVSFT